jgi:hypothetical protein
MHLLGYFVPAADNPLSRALSELQQHRANRNRMIVERLNDLGIAVTFEEVESEAGGPGAQIGRPHFAEVLFRHGVVASYQQAFDEYLAKGAKAYIGRKLYRPAQAVELMLGAGVVPVLAHPFTLNLSVEEIERFVEELIASGIKGIEGYHGDWTAEEQQPLRDIATRRGLIATGGSDYHGSMRPDRRLPGGKHGVVVPPPVLEALRSSAGVPGG